MSDIVKRARIASLLGQQFGGERDLYSALGYKKQLTYDDYYALYDRQDIAGRIVNMPASATWRNIPKIKEDDDEETQTPFEKAWEELANRLRVWHHFERVDRLAGIGRYAVLLIGVRGAPDLSTPLEPGSLSGPDDIIYLSPYSEKSATIHSWVTDPADPRFGRPETYEIDLAGTFGEDVTDLSAKPIQIVHHTRVLHVAENLLEDEVYGQPRLKRVVNLLYDLAKVVGGSAEMFWQGAFQGLHANIDKDIEFDLTGDEARKLSEELDEYVHGLRRYIRTRGMSITPLGGTIPDPRGVFEVVISLIAGTTGIPKRILLGAERGELASSQDETNWNSRIMERQQHFAEPVILRPFIDRLIWTGALPAPAEEYTVEWPNLFELSEQEKAEIVAKKAQALQQYASAVTAEEIVPVPEFRREFLGLKGLPSDEDMGVTEERVQADFNLTEAEMSEEFEKQMRRILASGGV
ncbi:MAG: DUF1073 domain-containing protein [Deltaproteobacteria bacterium]|nr:DUF1073 domain-containing protein [Deltaproteobacteria bacterium]